VQTDKVTGMAGTSSILECTIEHSYWEKLKRYGSNVSGGIGSFSQMGFTIAEIATHALESIHGPYTLASVNKAFEDVKNLDTGMLCQPWTFGTYAFHIANNVDYTVTPENGKMVIAHRCTPISAGDPQIAAYRTLAGD
jgi:hypothetical protein